MTHYWVVIANASQASILSGTTKNNALQLLHTLKHPENKMKNSELHTDKLGHYQTQDKRGGTYAEHKTPKEAEAEIFARNIARYLEQGKDLHQFSSLVICAAPHFYGMLEKHLSDYTKRMIKHSVKKDYTVLTIQEVSEILHTTLYQLSHRIVE